jgi:DNA repair protein SbcD/Mre11
VKILHSADIHLKSTDDERWESLQLLLSIARDQKIDVFVISGDLFHKDRDAENLRPKIRELFSDNEFPVLILPGNHDAGLITDMFFGKNVVLLRDLYQPYTIGTVTFYGFAFESMDEYRVLDRLQQLNQYLMPDQTNILLFHGELLDVMFKRSDVGEDDESGYMPVRLSFFRDLAIDYVLAGHFHTRFDIRSLPGGGYFVYPGSPVSITRRETGRRKVNILEIGNAPSEYLLDTPHYEEIIVALDPFDMTDPAEIVKQRLNSVHPHAKVLLTVEGYFNKAKIGRNERTLADEISTIASPKCIEIHIEFRDIQHLVDDELFTTFLRKLKAADDPGLRRKHIEELVIRAMIEAKR